MIPISIDGYSDLLNKSLAFKHCFDCQSSLNSQLQNLAIEAAKLPIPPSSLDDWMGSWGSYDGKNNFKLSNYVKLSKIKKEYSQLIDKSDSNLREMKIIIIDDLLVKINDLVK